MLRLTADPRVRPPSPAVRPPPRHMLTTLSIRTTNHPPIMAQPSPSSSTAPQISSEYPLPIPEEKMEKALKLYGAWRIKKALAEREAAGHLSSPYLDVPPAHPARSRTTAGSSIRNGTSISTSTYDATDLTSVVSFDESPSTAHEFPSFTTFNGTRVRPRVRRPFDPVNKARTALCRWLGSCPRCRERRVICPLEDHHDLALLERLHSEKSNHHQPRASRRSRSSSNVSQRTTRPGSAPQLPSAISQPDALLGLGQKPNLLQTYNATVAPMQDIPSPGGIDILSGIPTPGPVPSMLGSVGTNSQDQSSQGSYEIYANGGPLFIGLARNGYYFCQHVDNCDAYFDNVESLQVHFEQSHFDFIRQSPPERYICSACHLRNDDLSPCCQNCKAQATIETWIEGQVIKPPRSQHFPDNGPPPVPYNFFRSSSNFNFGGSQNVDMQQHPYIHGDGGNGPTSNMYGDDQLGDQNYDNTGHPTFDGNATAGAAPGTGVYHGGWLWNARVSAVRPLATRALFTNFNTTHRQKKLLILLILFLFTTSVFLIQTCSLHRSLATLCQFLTEIHDRMSESWDLAFVVAFWSSFTLKRYTTQLSSQFITQNSGGLRQPLHLRSPVVASWVSSTVGVHLPSYLLFNHHNAFTHSSKARDHESRQNLIGNEMKT